MNNRMYTVLESYVILYKGLSTSKYLVKAKKSGELNKHAIERIMLAVTEVNGCAVCSYAHTKMALEAGMSNAEVKELLSGISASVPEDELPAVMFAQHYAESRGKPSHESWDRIVEIYDESKALGILAAIRLIMVGNAFGMPYSSLSARFKGKGDKRSSICYEIIMMLAIIIYIPIVIFHLLLAAIFRPVINLFRGNNKYKKLGL